MTFGDDRFTPGPGRSAPRAEPAAPAGEDARTPLWHFAVLALTATAIVAAFFLLWQLRDALMMTFGAVVVAVLLAALADLLRRVLPLPHTWAVGTAALLILLLIVAFAWIVGAQTRTQFGTLSEALPGALEEIEDTLGVQLFGGDAPSTGQPELPPAIPRPDDAPAPSAAQPAPGGTEAGGAAEAGASDAEETAAEDKAAEDKAAEESGGLSRLWEWVGSYGYPVVNAIFGVILVTIAGVFLALQPETYRRGAVKLFPPTQHERVGETMTYMGRSLRYWLIGQLIAMAIVGLLVGLGTWAIGLPAPFALGLFAALVEFVPVVGPIVGAAPAVLLAFGEGGTMVLWTVLLFVAIQQVESNMISPLVQERMVDLPPAALLLAVLVFGGVFGILGVIFAAPLAVVTFVAVQKLWVRDALHETTKVTGEKPDPAR